MTIHPLWTTYVLCVISGGVYGMQWLMTNYTILWVITFPLQVFGTVSAIIIPIWLATPRETLLKENHVDG